MVYYKVNVVFLYLERIRDMNSFVINDYNHDPFFNHYFSSTEEWLSHYEKPVIDYTIQNLPDYVNTVLIFGCASGRDFIPFSEKYKCVGFDLAIPSKISWVCPTENLDYYQCSIEDFMDCDVGERFDLSKCLVYTQGVMMYVSWDDQSRFINYLINNGCKNIVLHEYPPDYTGPHTKLNPTGDILNLFERRHFRSEVQEQPTGFLYLNK